MVISEDFALSMAVMPGTGATCRNLASAVILLVGFGCSHAELPESGFWYDPEQPGAAFHFQLEEEFLFVTWLTYDGDGEATWYVGAGAVVSEEGGMHSLEVELQHYRDGQCAGCAWSQAQQESSPGTLSLTFVGHAQAEVEFLGSSTTIQPFVAVEPLFYSDSYFLGTWVLHFSESNSAETIEFGELEFAFDDQTCSPACLAMHPVIHSTIPEVGSLLCAPARSQFRGCFLSSSGDVVAEFSVTNIGRNTMIGRDSDGNRVTALRVPKEPRVQDP